MTVDYDDFDREFIDLGRGFFEYSSNVYDRDDFDMEQALYTRADVKWPDLLEESRVIILSEAGTGKTHEIRHTTRSLRRSGKLAFFMRLENIGSDFDIAFEEGTLEEFENWLSSNETAWLLLDSIDEAKLNSPKDSERAIKRLKTKISHALSRAHIVITGRTSAWRPKSDMDICKLHLPAATQSRNVISKHGQHDEGETARTELTASSSDPFKVFSLNDLSDEQIRAFSEFKGVKDINDFLDSIERADAKAYTARPQDLDELILFWNENGEIGSRRDIVERSIQRRLSERDPDRENANPITFERIWFGAKTLAAAATLTGQQSVVVPGGAPTSKALSVSEVLRDWDVRDQEALLSRPVFDEKIYEMVRFHHRSVREYLTAKWFADLLGREMSRERVESLFFKNQYGLDVITPTLRPILPWLAIFDQKILDRIMAIEPEVLLEGGDPSQLPFHVRQQTLRQVCKSIQDGQVSSASREYSAVQRFAHTDLEAEIRDLLTEYKSNAEIITFLLRMVWQGRLRGLLPEAMAIALDQNAGHYPRRVAFRAVNAVGSPADLEQVRTQFSSEVTPYNRKWLSELVDCLPSSPSSIDWLLRVLEDTEQPERYSLDELVGSLNDFVARTALGDLPNLVAGMDALAGREPHAERRYCEVSNTFGWLLIPISKAVELLVSNQCRSTLEPSILSALHRIASARFYGEHEITSLRDKFSELVPQWRELNHKLFWHEIEHERSRTTDGSRVTDYWRSLSLGSFAAFTADDFDDVHSEIQNKELIDDKLVALSLAFSIYRSAGRPPSWREKLKRTASHWPEVEMKLSSYLNPPKQSEDDRRWKQRNRAWERRWKEREAKEERIHAEWKSKLNSDLDKITAAQAGKPGEILNPLWYLFNQTRDNRSNTNRWTEYNWQCLIPEYGEGPSRFYRDACVNFWRHYRPVTRSEGAPMNETQTPTIIGLVGLEIEATEDSDWASKLTPDEAELACRYASFELNVFPTWFPQLFQAHPDTVIDFVMNEIRFELAVASAETPSSYILSDIAWSGDWMWDAIAPRLLDQVASSEPFSAAHLDYILTILQGSNLSDAEVSTIAEEKWRTNNDPTHLARWGASWVGSDPERAIPAIRTRTQDITNREERLQFVMELTSKIYNRRAEDGIMVRTNFMSAEYLKDLYYYVSEHIRSSEDIDRANTGVYSPGPRDRAQEARNGLFEKLTNLEGKAAFNALMELAASHPSIAHRSWMERKAKQRAELDSDIEKWRASDVREFADRYERTPRNHAELAELIIFRLLDLKTNLEEGDDSIAEILKGVADEETMRVFIGRELREKSNNRYVPPQEEELADGKRPDFRVYGSGFDNPVPIELKLAERWSGPHLFERLENQLCGDYLRDPRSRRGIFLIVRQGGQEHWQLPDSGERVDFDALIRALQNHWTENSMQYPDIDAITVIGIDLTKRTR